MSKEILSLKRKIKRSYFQLIEVMLALILITTCAFPCIKIYVNLYREQVNTIKSYERDHLAQMLHAKIMEKLYKRDFFLEDLLQENNVYKIEDITEDTEKIVSQLQKLSYTGSYQFIRKKPKVLKKNTSKYLFKIIISLNDTSKESQKPFHYSHLVYVNSQTKP